MATMTIRNIDEELKSRLRMRAAENGHSMEAEVRHILKAALDPPIPEKGLGTWMRKEFSAVGSVELDIPRRDETPRCVDLGE